MTTSVNDVIAAVIETVAAETGLLVHGIVDSPTLPCVMVHLATDDDIGADSYFAAFARGVYRVPVVLTILDASSDIEGAQRWVYDLISPHGYESIVRAIFENPTLGGDPDEHTGGPGATFAASVTRARFDGLVELYAAGPRVIAARVDVTVTVTLRDGD